MDIVSYEASLLSSVGFDIKKPQHLYEMLVNEGDVGQAEINLDLESLFISSSCPVGILHRFSERLRNVGFFGGNRERVMLCLDSAEDELVVMGQVVEPVLSNPVYIECLESIGVVALAGDVTKVTVDAVDTGRRRDGRETS